MISTNGTTCGIENNKVNLTIFINKSKFIPWIEQVWVYRDAIILKRRKKKSKPKNPVWRDFGRMKLLFYCYVFDLFGKWGRMRYGALMVALVVIDKTAFMLASVFIYFDFDKREVIATKREDFRKLTLFLAWFFLQKQ